MDLESLATIAQKKGIGKKDLLEKIKARAYQEFENGYPEIGMIIGGIGDEDFKFIEHEITKRYQEIEDEDPSVREIIELYNLSNIPPNFPYEVIEKTTLSEIEWGSIDEVKRLDKIPG